MTTKKKQRNASRLVGAITKKTTADNWYGLLSAEDKMFVLDVVKELRNRRDVAVNTVALALIEELGLKVKIQAVAKWLTWRRDHA